MKPKKQNEKQELKKIKEILYLFDEGKEYEAKILMDSVLKDSLGKTIEFFVKLGYELRKSEELDGR